MTTKEIKSNKLQKDTSIKINNTIVKVPKHIANLAFIMKNNAEIRRFTALGIINYLTQIGELKGESKYVSFKWNKFAIICDGLTKEYFYTETFFLNALVASFSTFSASSQVIINEFMSIELTDKNVVIDSKDIEDIVLSNEKYINTNSIEKCNGHIDED